MHRHHGGGFGGHHHHHHHGGWGGGYGWGGYRAPRVVPLYNPLTPVYYNVPPPIQTTVYNPTPYAVPPLYPYQQSYAPPPQQYLPPPPVALRCCSYSANYPIIRHVAIEKPIVRFTTINLYKHVPLYTVMVIYDSNSKLYRLATTNDRAPCVPETHLITDLADYTELTFHDTTDNSATVLVATSYCSTCGQHFFVQPPPPVASAPPF